MMRPTGPAPSTTGTGVGISHQGMRHHHGNNHNAMHAVNANAEKHPSSAKSAKVRVVLRLRPFLKEEVAAGEGESPCIRMHESSAELWNYRAPPGEQTSLKFDFDACYPEQSTQMQIFESEIAPLLRRSMAGEDATVFTFGPTGSGKTFTMQGSQENPGIIPRSLEWMFNRIVGEDARQWKYDVSLSYLEIYNEKVYDLLVPKDADLAIREDATHKIFVPNLAKLPISTLADFERLYAQGTRNRSTAATKLNSHSSRSHAVLIVETRRREHAAPFRVQVGRTCLIDLAGSEDNRRTDNVGMRLKESGAINMSLFVLSKVIDAINEGSSRVPYRDSKLTRLLQDSLGGHSRACMVTNVSPSMTCYMDTHQTLNYASKSRQIVNKPFVHQTVQKPAPPVDQGVVRPRSMFTQRETEKVADTVRRVSDPTIDRADKKQPTKIGPLILERKPAVGGANRPIACASGASSRSTASNGGLMDQLANLVRKLEAEPAAIAAYKKVHGNNSEVISALEKLVASKENGLAFGAKREGPKEGTKHAMNERKAFGDITNVTKNGGNQQQKAGLKGTETSKKRKVDHGHEDQDEDDASDDGCMEGGGMSDSDYAPSPVAVKAPPKPRAKRQKKDEAEQPLGIQIHVDPQQRSNVEAELLSILNSCDVQRLKLLNGIGEKRAISIAEYVKAGTPLAQLSDMTNIPGFGDKFMNSFLKTNLIGRIEL